MTAINKFGCAKCGKKIVYKTCDMITDVCNCDDQDKWFSMVYGDIFAFDSTVYKAFSDADNKCNSLSVFYDRIFRRKQSITEAKSSEVQKGDDDHWFETATGDVMQFFSGEKIIMTFDEAEKKLKELATGRSYSIGYSKYRNGLGEYEATCTVYIGGYSYHSERTFEIAIAKLEQQVLNTIDDNSRKAILYD